MSKDFNDRLQVKNKERDLMILTELNKLKASLAEINDPSLNKVKQEVEDDIIRLLNK